MFYLNLLKTSDEYFKKVWDSKNMERFFSLLFSGLENLISDLNYYIIIYAYNYVVVTKFENN